MAFRDHPIGQLVRVEPAKASAFISEQLAVNDGAIGPTAVAFDIDSATLRRWIGRLKEGGHEVGPVRLRGNPEIDLVRQPWSEKARKKARIAIRKREKAKKKANPRKRAKPLKT